MQRIKNLASLWKVSQAEVVRRAICGAQAPVSTRPHTRPFRAFFNQVTGLILMPRANTWRRFENIEKCGGVNDPSGHQLSDWSSR